MSKGMKWTVILLTIYFLYMPVTATATVNKETYAVAASAVSTAGRTSPSQTEETPSIDWFKKELGISDKYIEKHEGVLGLSWAHFLTMVFLICSFILGLIFAVVRHRRTKELLTIMSEEEPKHESER
jgi:hypothetical protein